MKEITFRYTWLSFLVQIVIKYDRSVFGEPKDTVTQESILEDTKQGRMIQMRFDGAVIYFENGLPSLVNSQIWKKGSFDISVKICASK